MMWVTKTLSHSLISTICSCQPLCQILEPIVTSPVKRFPHPTGLEAEASVHKLKQQWLRELSLWQNKQFFWYRSNASNSEVLLGSFIVFKFPWKKKQTPPGSICPLILSPLKQQQKAPELLVPRRPSLLLLISLSTLFIHQVTLQNCQTTFNFCAERWIWSLHINACLLKS